MIIALFHRSYSIEWRWCNLKCWSKNVVLNEVELVFCYQNCSDLLCEKIVLVIEKNFWNLRLKAEKFAKTLRSIGKFIHTMKGQTNAFLTCSWRFLRSNILEQLNWNWKKLLGFRNLQKKLEKRLFLTFPSNFWIHFFF